MGLVVTAWAATLLLSKLPLVIARELLGSDIPWIVPAWLLTAVVLLTATFVSESLRPLRSYFAVLGVILLLTTVLDPWVSQSAFWQGLFAGASPVVDLLSERLLIALSALLVLGVLFLFGYRRREVFLEAGDLDAPVSGLSLPGRSRPVHWLAFGAFMTVVLGGSFYFFLSSQNPAAGSRSAAVLSWLPLILLSAILNAFGEEAMYRAAPLATLLAPVGPKQALWMTSIWFGLGHYYGGVPSGLFGFVMTGLLGLLLGKAMLDTRGMGWSWFIHVVLDTVIYFFLAASMFQPIGT
jgi:membrane protease YdiL (CAAX protease family)